MVADKLDPVLWQEIKERLAESEAMNKAADQPVSFHRVLIWWVARGFVAGGSCALALFALIIAVEGGIDLQMFVSLQVVMGVLAVIGAMVGMLVGVGVWISRHR